MDTINEIADSAPKLFTAVKIGAIELLHRVVHPPLTRLRADSDDSPSAMMLDYYTQRASKGGLIITESAHPSVDSRGYIGAPGIYTEKHVQAWKKITDAVHEKGAKIVMQIAHDGRQSHESLSGGKPPVAPSEVPFEGLSFTKDGWLPVTMHRALLTHEIPELVEEFRVAAERALRAGFDGIEFHNANGYLADTFLQDGTNKRTDKYGGSKENRVRFSLEMIEALISVWGSQRVGVRVSPSGEWGSISDSDPEATFGYFAEMLNGYDLAYLHVIEPRIKGTETLHEGQQPVASSFLRKIFKGKIIAAGGFDKKGAEEILAKGDADAVAFGRYFTSNPDLPERLKNDFPLTPYNRDAFWGGNEEYYSDYKIYKEELSFQK